jgi:hypothetical protein
MTPATSAARAPSYRTSEAMTTSIIGRDGQSPGTRVQSARTARMSQPVCSGARFMATLRRAKSTNSASASVTVTLVAPAAAAAQDGSPSPAPSSRTSRPETKDGQWIRRRASARVAGHTTSPAPSKSRVGASNSSVPPSTMFLGRRSRSALPRCGQLGR